MPLCRFGVTRLAGVWGGFSRIFDGVKLSSRTGRMPTALLVLAEGAEEMEAVITADVMRRGGIDVTIAGLTGHDPVLCSRDIRVVPDASLADVADKQYDIIVIPGGAGGAKAVAESAKVGEMLKKQVEKDGYVAAVCAAPIALNSHEIGKGKTVTSHPSVKDTMTSGGYTYSEDRVVVDGKLITSRGPGTCFEFALKIVEELQGKEKSDSLVSPMLVKL